MIKASFVKAYEDAGRVEGGFLAVAIQKELEQLEADGYEVISVIPVVSGHGDDTSGDTATQAYSFTAGVIVVGRK